MPIDINGACSSMMLGLKKEEPELDWLTFTATQPLSSIRLDKSEDSPNLKARLEVRVNNGKWIEYKWNGTSGDEINLKDIGDRCQWRAVDFNNGFSHTYSAGYRFKSDNILECSGDLMSLIDRELKTLDISSFVSMTFEQLFYTGIKIVTCPDFNCKVGNRLCFEFTFANSKFLTNAFDIKQDYVSEGMYNGTWGGCDNIKTPPAITSTRIKRTGLYMTFNSSGLQKPLNLSSVKSFENDKSCFQIYYNCKDLTEASELFDYQIFGTNTFQEAYRGCTSLKEIHVGIHSWHEDKRVFLDWVKNVSPTGDFYCPADLPLIWDDSHIPIGWTAHPEGKEPVPYPDPLEDKYLRFTAEQDGSLLRLDKSKDVPELNARLEYKINSGNWQKYTWNGTEGALVSLPKVGDCVKFRAEDRNERFSVDNGAYGSDYYHYTFNGKVNGSGDLCSLLSKDLSVRDLPANCFSFLFSKSGINDSTIKLDFNIIGIKSLWSCFDNNNIKSNQSIKANKVGFYGLVSCYSYNHYFSGITLDIVDTTEDSYRQLLYSDNSINEIKVLFTKWYPEGNKNWVVNVSKNGTFTCPKELPVVFGNSNIPHGWKVDNGLTTVSEEEILNACYQYQNGRLIIQPDFRDCLNRAEQIDFVKNGKTYWKAGTPLPNPHRPDIDAYYKVTNLNNLFWITREFTEIDVSGWNVSEVIYMQATFGDNQSGKLSTIKGLETWNNSIVTNISLFAWNRNNLREIDVSGIDFSNVPLNNMNKSFNGCPSVTTAYARTQADCDKLNASEGKPTTWEFVIHPDLLNVPYFTINGNLYFTRAEDASGYPKYVSRQDAFTITFAPTEQADGSVRYVITQTSNGGHTATYVCDTPLDTPIDPTACTGRRQLLRDTTYSDASGGKHEFTFSFEEPPKPKKLKQFTVTETSAGADAVFRADGDTGAFVTQDSTPSIYPGARFVYAESSKTYQIIPVSPDIDPTWVSTGTPADGSFSQENLNGSNPYSALGMTLDLWFKDFVYE